MSLAIQNHEGNDGFELIESHQMAILDVSVKENQVIFLKIWETGQALLSGVDSRNLREKMDESI